MFEKLIEEIKSIDGSVVVQEMRVNKGGEIRDALVFGGTPLSVTIYPGGLKGTLHEVAERILATVKENQPDAIGATGIIDLIKDWNRAKDYLLLCMRPVTENDTHTVTRPYLDLEMYVRIMWNEFSTAVSYELIDYWNISPAVLFENAQFGDPTAYNFGEVAAIAGMPDEDIPFDECPMIVLSNKNRQYGASVLANIPYLAKIGARFGHRMLLLPSSIHECIAVPDDPTEADRGFLREMVKEINRDEVDPREVLSDSVYRFADGQVTIL